ncbi:hypothetical protein H9Q71_011550 [Fusarium xylarioides]|nr:hypothetical protein H9Q71_011550 [Fusarium xylarioides]
MDVIPVEQMNIAMLIRLVQMMLYIIQEQNTQIQGLTRRVQDLANQVYAMRLELSQLRAGIVPGLDAGSEAVEEGPETPDTLLHSLDVNYQLPEYGEGGNDQTDQMKSIRAELDARSEAVEGPRTTNTYHPTQLNINCPLEKNLALEEEHQQRYFDFWRSEEGEFAKQVTNNEDGAGHQSQQI